MKRSTVMVIMAALVFHGCQARADAPAPRVEVDRQVEDRTQDQLFDASVGWLRNAFAAEETQVDITDREAGLVMAKVTLNGGAKTVIDTPMPLRITVTIDVHAQGYRAVFDGFQLPRRWIGKVPAPGKELESALHTVHGLADSLAEHLAVSPLHAFPIEH